MRAAVLACVLVGCATSAPGTLDVQLTAEDTILEGLASGSAEEDIVDGWSASFETYVVVVGGVAIAGGGEERVAGASIAIDLRRIGEAGRALARFEHVPAGLWPEVGIDTRVADASTVRDETVEPAALDRMIEEGCTYLIAGAIDDGARRVAFDLCVPAEAHYGPCESDTGIEGVTVAAGATTTMGFTFHGDHLFFNGFPVGAEGSVARRAQWMADADADGDGVLTRSDLESIGPSELGTLFPSDPGDGFPGFSLGAAPRIDEHGIRTAWDYVRAQLLTQTHFQGEGECVVIPR